MEGNLSIPSKFRTENWKNFDEGSEQSNYSSRGEDSDGELIITTEDDLPIVDEVCLFKS